MKGCFIALLLIMTAAINVEDNALARLGFESDYLMMALAAIVITFLIFHQGMMLVVLVLALSAGANLPEEVVASYGVDRDYILGVLGAVVIIPLVAKLLDL